MSTLYVCFNICYQCAATSLVDNIWQMYRQMYRHKQILIGSVIEKYFTQTAYV